MGWIESEIWEIGDVDPETTQHRMLYQAIYVPDNADIFQKLIRAVGLIQRLFSNFSPVEAWYLGHIKINIIYISRLGEHT